MKESRWLELARDLIGVREIKGNQHEPQILSLWKDAGLPFADDETAWCAALVGGTLARAGIKPSGSAAARSYLSWGTDVMHVGLLHLPLGCVGVFSRPPSDWQGHVGYPVGYTLEGTLMVLGGNQSDRVSIAPIAAGRLIGARWPAEDATEIRLLPRIPQMTSRGAVSTNEA